MVLLYRHTFDVNVCVCVCVVCVCVCVCVCAIIVAMVFVQGLVQNLLGPTQLDMASRVRLQLNTMAPMFSIRGIGDLAASVTLGFLFDRFENWTYRLLCGVFGWAVWGMLGVQYLECGGVQYLECGVCWVCSIWSVPMCVYYVYVIHCLVIGFH